jgi:hypothetical protein
VSIRVRTSAGAAASVAAMVQGDGDRGACDSRSTCKAFQRSFGSLFGWYRDVNDLKSKKLHAEGCGCGQLRVIAWILAMVRGMANRNNSAVFAVGNVPYPSCPSIKRVNPAETGFKALYSY